MSRIPQKGPQTNSSAKLKKPTTLFDVLAPRFEQEKRKLLRTSAKPPKLGTSKSVRRKNGFGYKRPAGRGGRLDLSWLFCADTHSQERLIRETQGPGQITIMTEFLVQVWSDMHRTDTQRYDSLAKVLEVWTQGIPELAGTACSKFFAAQSESERKDPDMRDQALREIDQHVDLERVRDAKIAVLAYHHLEAKSVNHTDNLVFSIVSLPISVPNTPPDVEEAIGLVTDRAAAEGPLALSLRRVAGALVKNLQDEQHNSHEMSGANRQLRQDLDEARSKVTDLSQSLDEKRTAHAEELARIQRLFDEQLAASQVELQRSQSERFGREALVRSQRADLAKQLRSALDTCLEALDSSIHSSDPVAVLIQRTSLVQHKIKLMLSSLETAP
jgi:hypothetical protein